MSSNGSKNVCPTGWHVPTDVEWTTLTNYLGGTGLAGGKMKEAGLAYWISPNEEATNESGFAGLLGGNRNTDGLFLYIGNFGDWWSSTENNASGAYYRFLYHINDNVYRNFNNKGFRFSVRCLRD
jgi:uncharacterized protein (TIGR02145 family)